MHTPVYEESLTELTEIYGNFSFLGYPNVSGLDPFERNLMLSNPDARVFFCKYDKKPEAWNPENCNTYIQSFDQLPMKDLATHLTKPTFGTYSQTHPTTKSFLLSCVQKDMIRLQVHRQKRWNQESIHQLELCFQR